MKPILTLLAFLICFTSCTDKDDEQTTEAICDTSNSEFKQVYTNFLSGLPSIDQVTMDTETHEYTFFVTNAKTICSIGYQSAHADPTVPYTIEIINNATATTIYSGSHLFLTTGTTYITPTATVNLQANVSYTIRRIQTNWGSTLGNTLGRVAYSNTSLLPMISGDLHITSAGFGSSVGQVNNSLPYIDIVFES